MLSLDFMSFSPTSPTKINRIKIYFTGGPSTILSGDAATAFIEAYQNFVKNKAFSLRRA